LSGRIFDHIAALGWVGGALLAIIGALLLYFHFIGGRDPKKAPPSSGATAFMVVVSLIFIVFGVAVFFASI
jgi:hypothetical protein